MSSLCSSAVSPVRVGAVLAARTCSECDLQSHFACISTLYFFHNTILVLTYEYVHCNAITDGHGCSNRGGGLIRDATY